MGHRNVASSRAPLGSLDEVVSFLRSVMREADLGLRAPAHGAYACTYLRMTLEVLAHISAFEDPAWIARFTVAFAERYRLALFLPAERNEPWRITFAEADKAEPRYACVLMLAINAHASYDLAAVLADSALDDPAVRYDDFVLLDRMLSRAVDPVGKLLGDGYCAWMRSVDRAARGVDEAIIIAWLRRVRMRAWHDALKLMSCRLSYEELERRIAGQSRRIDAAVPI